MGVKKYSGNKNCLIKMRQKKSKVEIKKLKLK